MELMAAHAPKSTSTPPSAPSPAAPRTRPCSTSSRRAASRRAEDIVDLFVTPFFFGCEADDPMVRMAFDTAANPFGSTLKAIFGSDIAHWDVPDMAEVLERGARAGRARLIDEDDFRDFVFTNPVRFFTDVNPDFFDGHRRWPSAVRGLDRREPA